MEGVFRYGLLASAPPTSPIFGQCSVYPLYFLWRCTVGSKGHLPVADLSHFERVVYVYVVRRRYRREISRSDALRSCRIFSFCITHSWLTFIVQLRHAFLFQDLVWKRCGDTCWVCGSFSKSKELQNTASFMKFIVYQTSLLEGG
jgi:hypothetical protein